MKQPISLVFSNYHYSFLRLRFMSGPLEESQPSLTSEVCVFVTHDSDRHSESYIRPISLLSEEEAYDF